MRRYLAIDIGLPGSRGYIVRRDGDVIGAVAIVAPETWIALRPDGEDNIERSRNRAAAWLEGDR